MSLERIALDMVTHYDRYKYDRHATLHGFALYWEPSQQCISADDRVFPDNPYYASFKGFVDVVKAAEGDTWKQPHLRLPPAAYFDKPRLLGEAIANMACLRRKFVDVVEGELKCEVDRILSDVPLIVESADTFIDCFDPTLLERDPQKCTLEYFLQHFDVDKKVRMKIPKRSYVYMLYRLQREEPAWERLYMERLEMADGKLHGRLHGLFEDIAANDLEKQERLRMIECLLENGNAGIVDLLGSDAYDVLVALYGEDKFPEGKRHMLRRSVIREELGTCRRRKAKVHDAWHKSMIDSLLGRGLKQAVYDKNVVVQRVLQNHFIAPYLERVCAGEDVLPELHREAGKPGLDWLRQRLFGYAVQHFMVMSEVRQLPGIRNHLTAVTIRKDYK